MSDYRDLDPSTFDAIILATPNFSHIDILRVVIPWKKHLLVEKPMCTVTPCAWITTRRQSRAVALTPGLCLSPVLRAGHSGRLCLTRRAGQVVGDCMEVQALLDEHMRQDAATIAKGGPIYWVGMEYR